jgi:hypothetical protein
MFNNMPNSNVQIASEEDLLAAAGEAKPTGKGGKDDKTDTKDKKDKTDEKDKKTGGKSDKSDKSSGKSDPKKTVTALSRKDLEAAAGSDDDDDNNDDDDDQNNDDQNDDTTDKTKTKKVVKKAKEADETDDTNDEDQNDDDNDNNDEDNTDDNDENNDDENNNDDADGPIAVKDFLKARVSLLLKKGEWVDFEGSDDVEWDEDAFAEMEIQQRNYQKEQLREELLDSFGPYGREIADYTANGGDPEQLIDIFKEQQRVVNLSIESEDDQKAVVLKYVTEFQNMKPKQAQTYINALIADKELETTAKEAKESMEADLKAQEKELKDTQAEAVRKAQATTKANLEKFSKDVNGVLASRDDIPADEKKEILKVLTKFDKKLQNGTPVNDFYFKFAEFRKDLPNYLELVRFVMNPKKYKATVKNTGKSETAEKAFSLVRTDNKSKKTKTSTGTADENRTGKKKTTFKLLY